ncbi:MAG: tRNA1(Val) (adenine(37)-N6)-methyltransferase [Kofleriaceae bacterium]
MIDLGEVTVDQLTIGWTIAQRKKGHRHSTDDLLTGWYAAEKMPRATRLLDLGAGIGSVGLLALWRAPAEATLVSIEAQAVSFALLQRNLADNQLGDRVRAIHGDLRETALDDQFQLVTGSPPYWDVSEGVLPDDPQKQAARFELRGTVADYAVAARRFLDTDGRFVFCFPSVQRERAVQACHGADLVIETERAVIPRRDAPPLFSLFCARRAEDAGATGELESPHVVRDETGDPTAMHAAARATFGFTTSPR